MKDTQRYKDRLQYLDCTCVDISQDKWNELMANARKANGSKIRRMIKKQLPELYTQLALQFPNTYEQQSKVSKEHYIYSHSAIEYFIKRN